MRPAIALAVLLLLTPLTLPAQHGGSMPSASRAPREAAQYDFLVGQWELTVTPKVPSLAAFVHGQPRLHGSWKAWRALDGWGVEDELRIVDESGNPRSLTQALRVYDPSTRKWIVATADAYRQRIAHSTAQWRGTEMVGTGTGADGDGRSYMVRTRMTAITPTSFRFVQDRSDDGGATWDEARLVIDAKRVAAAAAR